MEPTRSDVALRRDNVLSDRSLRGPALTHALAAATDEWLAELFAAVVPLGADDLALLAVGGYGRGGLCPGSDLDLLLLHTGRRDISGIAERLWYPIWDRRLKLGHSVRTPRDALSLALDDLDTATSLLHVRTIAGNPVLGDRLCADAREVWTHDAERWVAALGERAAARAEAAGELAFLLEPDLKESRGGLRDVQSLRWAQLAQPMLEPDDHAALDAAEETLVSARVELHRATGRPGDRLLLQEQDGVAVALDDRDADVLMARLADAARTVSLIGDEVFEQADAARVRRRRGRDAGAGPLGGGLVEGPLGIELAPDAPPIDATLVVRAAATAAQRGVRIARGTLDELAAAAPIPPLPWPPELLGAFVELLLAGRGAIPVIEALDHRGLWVALLPEWAPNRSRPQRNAYHRFTVDRHLWEAAAEAASLADRVQRPDLLVLGALLHDIGKGHPGDHTDAGMELVASIGPRLGLPPNDVAALVSLVEHHLLLPDTATRRDLDDEGTIATIARAVGDHTTLDLLAALTEADSIATGPAAWGEWKAQLVAMAVERTHRWLDGHLIDTASYPPPELAALMATGEETIVTETDRVSVIAPDRPGLFSRVASVLTLHGLDVRDAMAGSVDSMACSTWHVTPGPAGEIPWAAVRRDLERVLRNRLAVDARLAERAAAYRTRRVWAARLHAARVTFDNEISESATVIEVQADDRLGLLARVTRTLADLGIDIRRAKIQTLGGEVVDAFYVVDLDGEKLTDEEHQREIVRAVLHAIDTAPGRSAGAGGRRSK